MGQYSDDEPTEGRTGQQTQEPTRQGPQDQPPERTADGADDTGEQVTSWFTETLVRTVVALFGLALLLLALGQLVGIELLSIVGDFLTSSTGMWLVIAFFALLLIVAASKNWNISNQ